MTLALRFAGHTLVTVDAPLDAWDFALPILDFLNVNAVPVPKDMAECHAGGDMMLDEILCAEIPCYTMAALLRDDAVRQLRAEVAT